MILIGFRDAKYEACENEVPTSILQRRSVPEFAMLLAHTAQHGPTELAFSSISTHEQVSGCHAYISRSRTASEVANMAKTDSVG